MPPPAPSLVYRRSLSRRVKTERILEKCFRHAGGKQRQPGAGFTTALASNPAVFLRDLLERPLFGPARLKSVCFCHCLACKTTFSIIYFCLKTTFPVTYISKQHSKSLIFKNNILNHLYLKTTFSVTYLKTTFSVTYLKTTLSVTCLKTTFLITYFCLKTTCSVTYLKTTFSITYFYLKTTCSVTYLKTTFSVTYLKQHSQSLTSI